MLRTTLAIVLLPVAACAQAGDPVAQGAPNADFTPAFPEQTRAPALDETAVTVEDFATGLAHPWGIAVLPDGGYLVTERPGQLRRVAADGSLSEPLGGVPEVDAREQGGLLDVAVADDFAETRRVWLTYAKRVDGGTVTAAATGVLSADGTRLEQVEDIFVQTPPSQNPMHYGSRVIVAPGGEEVFITTGEHFSMSDREKAQDLDTTYGKIVRVGATDGTAPDDNPFVGGEGIDSIWSYGHRNIQGAAIRPETGELWVIEHGPAGGDELNLIEPGANYGWPVVSYGVTYSGNPVGSGEASAEGMEQPVYYWDPVIAPGGMTFYQADLFDGWQGDALIGGLVASAVVRLELEDGLVVGEERVAEGIGRVRDVDVAPDGALLVLIDAPAPDGGIKRIAPAE
ncbi:Putative glucose dehydrogenase B [Oceanicola granulosus HTCC2516]|uniref:Putative glucose dehydrogenase B n=1 Tax=Oceanicola granulosus (strain ATCC BAA-861 / DSM 15982 / KCTC 12143 / HTCC2516) TaxID=314256 RepID=Q2CKC7_OCEGH|nr:PQQ-dependent sugar dehydrogenase [Oceanicola granulosus]EAR52862.1 Putative glucose dehydrogenase B [Oceanicola granulosus HTCC2516]